MPDPKPNETQEEWMERCVPALIDEGRPQDQAVAICLSKFGEKAKENYINVDKQIQEGNNVTEEAKNMEVMATSFAELDKLKSAHEQMRDMEETTAEFNMLTRNIMSNPLVEDKVAAMKALTEEFAARVGAEGEKAVWSGAFINDLPDSSFLYIGSGGEKDGEGKTAPRDLRKFPYKDKEGKIDLPHLRNAIARIPQATGISEERKTQLQEKARRILEKQGEKTFLSTIKGWFDDLRSLIANNVEVELPVDYNGKAVRTIKGKNGEPWIVVWTTNAFQDREKEIFTTKSIDDFVARHKEDDVKGEFWFWHLPKSKFGDIKLQSRVGRFLVEAGPFDDTATGRAFKEFFETYPDAHPTIAPEGWGASHGYVFEPEDRKDGIYEWFEKKESSVLPLVVASNPHNPKMTIKEVNSLMDEKQREAWNEALGSDFVDGILQVGETKTAELEQNVEFKGEPATEEEVAEEVKEDSVEEEVTEEVTEETVKEDETEEVVEEVVEEKETAEPTITRQELSEALKMVVEELTSRFEKKISDEIETTVDAMVEVIIPLANQVKALSQSDEHKIAQQAQSVPTSSLTTMVKESLFGKETHIDGRSSLAKDSPEETKEEASNGPTVGGVKLNLW